MTLYLNKNPDILSVFTAADGEPIGFKVVDPLQHHVIGIENIVPGIDGCGI